MTTVVIPLDASEHSSYCLDYYLKHLHKEGNKVRTVYVADYFGDVGVMQGPTPGRIIELEEQDRLKSGQIEAKVLECFRAGKINGDFQRTAAKDVWHEIINYAKSVNANFIVMGSRGMGTMRRTLLGSVSESVLHHSEIPVLICKHPHTHHHKH